MVCFFSHKRASEHEKMRDGTTMKHGKCQESKELVSRMKAVRSHGNRLLGKTVKQYFWVSIPTLYADDKS